MTQGQRNVLSRLARIGMYDSTSLGRSHAMSAVSLRKAGLVRVYQGRVGPAQYTITEAGLAAIGLDRFGERIT